MPPAARHRNSHPCGHCKKNRQGCRSGYPCDFCVKLKRPNCTPDEVGIGRGASEGFVRYDLNEQRSLHLQSYQIAQSGSDVRNVSPNNAFGTSGGRNSSSQSQQSVSNNGSGGFAGHSSATSGSRSLGQMQLIGPNGQTEGFIESFIHTHNGVAYYGARYYDQNGVFAKEDTFLSRVGENDLIQMPPPDTMSSSIWGHEALVQAPKRHPQNSETSDRQNLQEASE